MAATFYADRVRDTSTTTGTGDFTLTNTAPSGFQTFEAAFSHSAGNTFYYCIDGGSEWEVGIGTLSSSTNLQRSTILASSNANAAVNFSAGTKYVFCTIPASFAAFRHIPLSSKSANYTTVLSDAGGGVLHPAADANARTFTIDSNANVPYPVFTTLTFVNETSQVVTIAITTDTLTLANSTTTGSRSLAQNGIATAYKITSTKWIISGVGLS